MKFGIGVAMASMGRHKLRTVLAMLGVFLGALALTGVQHLSLAMVRKAEVEVERFGPNLFVARMGRIRVHRSGAARAHDVARTFTLADARALLDHMPSAMDGAPFVSDNMPVRNGAAKILCQLVGTIPGYQRVRSFRPAHGRFFSEAEMRLRAKVCVLGQTIATNLFGSPEAAVGRDVFFFNAPSRVIGVMEEKGADIVGTDQDEQVFVPITTYMRRYSNQDWITGVYIELAQGADPEQAKTNAADILRRRHSIGPGEDDDFSLLTAKDTIQMQEQALALVGTLGLISSGVSFAVGGLGVLSIMILLVRARRLEIGVRRAVGARQLDIVQQFMLEAGLLSGAGGALGVLCALALVGGVYALGIFPPVFSPLVIGGTLAGSALLGLAAGLYPAWQASRLEILDVLRSQE